MKRPLSHIPTHQPVIFPRVNIDHLRVQPTAVCASLEPPQQQDHRLCTWTEQLTCHRHHRCPSRLDDSPCKRSVVWYLGHRVDAIYIALSLSLSLFVVKLINLSSTPYHPFLSFLNIRSSNQASPHAHTDVHLRTNPNLLAHSVKQSVTHSFIHLFTCSLVHLLSHRSWTCSHQCVHSDITAYRATYSPHKHIRRYF